MRRALLVTLASLALLATPLFGVSRMDANATCANPGFVAPDAYPVPAVPLAIAQGDFNNDTRVDILALSNNGLSHFAVLLSNADGTFQDPILTNVDISAGLMTVGDFDNDGNLDIVAETGFSYWVMLGNGNGTFQAPVEVTGNFVWQQLVAARVDDDANLDLVVYGVGFDVNQIGVYLGNGDGSFQPPIILDDTANSIAVAKLDADSHADLVITGGSGGGITIYPGNGDGTFGSPTTLEPGFPLTWVRAADLNNDGAIDLLAPAGFGVNAYLGHGDGTFDAGIHSDTSTGAWTTELGDFDGDGVLDLAVIGFNQIDGIPPFILVFLGNGDGTFRFLQAYVGSGLSPLLVGDFAGDGIADVAFTNTTDPLVFVARGHGDGTLAAQRLFSASQFVVFQAVIGDFDGDGQPDIAQVLRLGAEPDLFVSLLDDNLRTRTVFEYSLPGLSSQGLVMADFNGDGVLDLVAVDVDHSIHTLLGFGDGSFGSSIDSPGASGDTFVSVVEGDLDGDQYPDLVIATQTMNGAFGALEVELNNGDGTFRHGTTIPLFVGPTSLVLAHFSSDANLDLAVVGGVEPGKLFVLRGLGDGTFAAAGEYDTPVVPLSVVAADLVEDGVLDLAVLSGFPAELTVFQGFNDAVFGFLSVSALPFPYAATLAAADFDADGHIDLTTGNAFLAGVGDGTFVEATFYGSAFIPRSLVTADIDRNGTTDALATSFQIGAFLLSAHLGVRASPEASSLIVGSSFLLGASVSGFGTLSYQWRKDGTPLADGGTISGATTATLTIDPVAFADAGSYDVLVTDSCGSTASNAATLSVEFDDVPLDNPFHDDILTIATAGITGGCTDTSYCPSNPVSRAEMAVFLLKSKYGSEHVPPPPPPVPIYPDVPADAFAAAWIDELATLEITTGCGGGLYCPDRSVSRAEMAVLLLKTFLGSGYVPPAPSGIFADVPLDYFAIAWIEDLYNRGITAGCGINPLRYCPDANVPREQMATFLVRTFLGP